MIVYWKITKNTLDKEDTEVFLDIFSIYVKIISYIYFIKNKQLLSIYNMYNKHF